MARSHPLAAAAVLLAAASTGALGLTPTSSVELLPAFAAARPPYSDPASNVTCDACVAHVTEAAIAGAGNASALAAFLAAVDAGCEASYPGPANATSLAMCLAAAEATGAALPWLEKQLETLAWNPFAVCATVVGACLTPCCATPSIPEQVHLSMLEDDGALYGVTWATLSVDPSVGGAGGVQWWPGTAGAAACSQTPPPAGAQSRPALNARSYDFGGWVGYIHRATITPSNSTPSSSSSSSPPPEVVCYRVGSDAGGWSPALPFAVPPANVGNLTAGGRPLRFMNSGDMAYDVASDGTVRQMAALATAPFSASAPAGSPPVDLILQVGDNSYSDGFEQHADFWGAKITAFASYAAMQSVPGNHESMWANMSNWRARFFMPGPSDSLYHSINVGPVHFVLLNTESELDTPEISDDQFAWLQADLALAASPAQRARRPLIVVSGHRPMYCSDKGNAVQCTTYAALLRDKLEALFLSSGVDLVLAAHEHGYERSFPISGGGKVANNGSYVDPGAPVYIVNGAAGNREGNERPSGDQPWSAFQSGEYSFALAEVSVGGGAATIAWRQVNSTDGSTLDAWTLTKTLLA